MDTKICLLSHSIKAGHSLLFLDRDVESLFKKYGSLPFSTAVQMFLLKCFLNSFMWFSFFQDASYFLYRKETEVTSSPFIDSKQAMWLISPQTPKRVCLCLLLRFIFQLLPRTWEQDELRAVTTLCVRTFKSEANSDFESIKFNRYIDIDFHYHGFKFLLVVLNKIFIWAGSVIN